LIKVCFCMEGRDGLLPYDKKGMGMSLLEGANQWGAVVLCVIAVRMLVLVNVEILELATTPTIVFIHSTSVLRNSRADLIYYVELLCVVVCHRSACSQDTGLVRMQPIRSTLTRNLVLAHCKSTPEGRIVGIASRPMDIR
jgi:hypothetical protein